MSDASEAHLTHVFFWTYPNVGSTVFIFNAAPECSQELENSLLRVRKIPI